MMIMTSCSLLDICAKLYRDVMLEACSNYRMNHHDF